MSILLKRDHNYKLTIAFDVDGTLIHLSDNSPRYEVIDLFFKFKKLGFNMIIWSGGGIDYAKHWSRKLGLDARVLEKGSISPDITIDDMETAMGKVVIRV